MENASKELLIAAAVLIVIMIIAVSMRILNSTSNISDDAEAVGEAISSTGKDASKGAISALKDTSSKNLIKVPNQHLKGENERYSITVTKFILEKEKNYKLQFDYEIIDASHTVYFGIGVGESDIDGSDALIIDSAFYPNQTEGTCEYTLNYSNLKNRIGINLNQEKIFTKPLVIRFVRMREKRRL